MENQDWALGRQAVAGLGPPVAWTMGRRADGPPGRWAAGPWRVAGRWAVDLQLLLAKPKDNCCLQSVELGI